MPDTPRDALQAEAERLVDRWFFESFHGSAVARSTQAWNHVRAAADELKRRLSAFLAEI